MDKSIEYRSYNVRSIMLRSGLVVLVALLCTVAGHCQQEAQFTQYMYNTNALNPAYAGSRGYLDANLFYRSQWVGLDGAPRTATFSVSTPIYSDKMGLGVNILNDAIGPANETRLTVDYSYTLHLSYATRLSFGIKGGVNWLNVNFDELDPEIPVDPVFQNNIENQITPQVGFGLYLHDRSKWYLGVSTPNFLQSETLDGITTSFASRRTNFYMMGGYVRDWGDYIKVKPSFLAKAVSGAPISMDLAANVLFYEQFDFGLSYRWGASFNAMAGIRIAENWFLGYAYDFDTSALAAFNSGTHEIFVKFKMPSNIICDCDPRRYY